MNGSSYEVVVNLKTTYYHGPESQSLNCTMIKDFEERGRLLRREI